MKILKDILLFILLLLASLEWHVQVLMFSFPVPPREYHMVFNYSEGGRIDVDYYVFTVYSLASIAFAGLTVVFVKRFHWALIAACSIVVPAFRVFGIYDLDYASPMFRGSVVYLLFLLAPVIMAGTYGCVCLDSFIRKSLRNFKDKQRRN